MQMTTRARHRSAAFAALACLLLPLLAIAQPTTLRPPRKGKSFTVTIGSTPAPATIYLDDKVYGPFGITPWKGKLVAGSYLLIVEREGSVPSSQTIEVTAKSRTFNVLLERAIKPATIGVNALTDPHLEGATITIDGKASGVVPSKADVPPGRHQIVVSKAGFLPFSQWVEVGEGETVQLSPALKPVPPETGALLLDASVPGAHAAVDGKPVLEALPTVVEGLTAGAHVVDVTAEGAKPWRETVTVVAGQRTKVSATMTMLAKSGSMLVACDVPTAEIHIDGVRRSEVPPIVLDDVPAGPHTVEGRAEGQSSLQNVVVEAGQRTRVDVLLAAKVAQAQGNASATAAQKEAARLAAERAALDKAKADHEAALKQQAEAQNNQAQQAQNQQTEAQKAEAQKTEADKAEMARKAEEAQKAAAAAAAAAQGNQREAQSSAQRMEQQNLDQRRQESARQDRMEQRQLEADRRAYEAARMKTLIGGRILSENKVAIDLYAGLPYYAMAQGSVGLSKGGGLDMDLGVFARSMFTSTDGGLRLRFGLREGELFSALVDTYIAGGKGMGGRNSFSFGAAAVGSLVIGERVALSGRVALDAWSDRLCPELGSEQNVSKDGADVCFDKLSAKDKASALTAIDGKLTDRDTGARLTIGLSLEIAVSQSTNLGLQVDYAPSQSPRAAYSGLFNDAIFFDLDPMYSGRAGFTFVF